MAELNNRFRPRFGAFLLREFSYSLRVSRPIEFARKTLKKRHLALAA
jgi:hypothetical protein